MVPGVRAPAERVGEYGIIDYGGLSGAFGDDGFAVPGLVG